MWKVKGECSQNKDEGRRSFVSLVIVITFWFSFFFAHLYSLKVLHGLSWNASCLPMSSVKGRARTRCDRHLCPKGNHPKLCNTELSIGYKARCLRPMWNVRFCFIFILQLLYLHFDVCWWHKLICLLSLDRVNCLYWSQSGVTHSKLHWCQCSWCQQSKEHRLETRAAWLCPCLWGTLGKFFVGSLLQSSLPYLEKESGVPPAG